MPIKETKKSLSAIFSKYCSFFISCVLIDKNERKLEAVSNNAIIEVYSSIRLFFELLVACNEVITKRQKPSRFAEVPRICCEVVLAILFF